MSAEKSHVIRRGSLGDALDDIERGTLTGTSSILLSRGWWHTLSPRERNDFRHRSKRAGIVLRASVGMTPPHVEVRGAAL